MTATEARLGAVDRATLTPLVRSALANNEAEVAGWKMQQLSGGVAGGTAMGGSAIYRFSGEAGMQGGLRPWTLILKILHPGGSHDPSGSHYWKREAEVYRSGMLDRLPAGLKAPRCFGLADHPGESFWLWLEDVKEEIGQWPLERYGVAARHLGSFNARYLTDQPALGSPWLSKHWIRRDLEQAGALIDQIDASLRIPLVRRLFPGDAAAKVFRLWGERNAFLAALDLLPQTLCHFDAFRRNMFARRPGNHDETVLIDWAFLGQGAVGAEIVSPVWVTLIFAEVDAKNANELSEVMFHNYLRGLRDAGWKGSERDVRLGYSAAVALRRLGTIGYALPMFLDEVRHGALETLVGRKVDELADIFAQAGRFVEALAAEARDLMSAG